MKKWLKNFKKENGFTLIEMTIVIMVIAILLIVFIPNLTKVNDNVGKTTDDALVQTIEAQKILYESQNGTEPDAEDLKNAHYITEKQYNAYTDYLANKAISGD